MIRVLVRPAYPASQKKALSKAHHFCESNLVSKTERKRCAKFSRSLNAINRPLTTRVVNWLDRKSDQLVYVHLEATSSNLLIEDALASWVKSLRHRAVSRQHRYQVS